MQPSIVEVRTIILDGGTTPGRLPPARGAAQGRLDCIVDLAILRGHAQVPDLTVDCIIRPRRRRRRRLSGVTTQTSWFGSRTGLVCPSPVRMAARGGWRVVQGAYLRYRNLHFRCAGADLGM